MRMELVTVARHMRCPECENEQLQLLNDTTTTVTGNNYSGGKGCLGYLMFGPLGLLCGSCGQGQKVQAKTKKYWVCSKCGHRFRDPDEWRTEVKQLRTSSIGMIVLGVIFFLMSCMTGDMGAGLVALATFAGLGVWAKLRTDKDLAEINRLDQFLHEQQ